MISDNNNNTKTKIHTFILYRLQRQRYFFYHNNNITGDRQLPESRILWLCITVTPPVDTIQIGPPRQNAICVIVPHCLRLSSAVHELCGRVSRENADITYYTIFFTNLSLRENIADRCDRVTRPVCLINPWFPLTTWPTHPWSP